MTNQVRVWDLPTRIFHWSLAACVLGLVVTGHIGSAIMPWHARLGYIALSLLLFRIFWGFFGGHWSRFSSFLYSPRIVVAHLRGQAQPDQLVGHSPSGALSVLAMLAFLLIQIATGVVGEDEIAFTGPLNKFVNSGQALAATWYHKRIGQWIIVGLVGLHVAAVLCYFWQKQNLIKPMLHGNKRLPHNAVPARDDVISRITALVALAVSGCIVAALVQLGA